MVCSLICKQMSKRDDGYGSVRSRAAKAVDDCAEASDRRGEACDGRSVSASLALLKSRPWTVRPNFGESTGLHASRMVRLANVAAHGRTRSVLLQRELHRASRCVHVVAS